MDKHNKQDSAQLDESALDLLHRGIDGELGSGEQETLDELLAASKKARDLHDELSRVNRLLEELPEVTPPDYLQNSIERQVRLPVQNHADVKKPGLIGNWLNANWLRTGFALAAGVVLTVGVYEMGSGPIDLRDNASLSGTMIKPGQLDQHGKLLDSIRLETKQLDGLVEVHGEGDLITLDVQLNSDGPSEVIVNFSGRGLVFDSVNNAQDQFESVAVVNGAIHLASRGQQRYTVSLRRTSASPESELLDLTFLADRELVQKAELNISTF